MNRPPAEPAFAGGQASKVLPPAATQELQGERAARLLQPSRATSPSHPTSRPTRWSWWPAFGTFWRSRASSSSSIGGVSRSTSKPSSWRCRSTDRTSSAWPSTAVRCPKSAARTFPSSARPRSAHSQASSLTHRSSWVWRWVCVARPWRVPVTRSALLCPRSAPSCRRFRPITMSTCSRARTSSRWTTKRQKSLWVRTSPSSPASAVGWEVSPRSLRAPASMQARYRALAAWAAASVAYRCSVRM